MTLEELKKIFEDFTEDIDIFADIFWSAFSHTGGY